VKSRPPAYVLRAVREGHSGGLITRNSAPVRRELVDHGIYGAHHFAISDVCVRCIVLAS
jgi:hypothetical protein